MSSDITVTEKAPRLFKRLRQLVAQRGPEQNVEEGILTAIAEQEALLSPIKGDSHKNSSTEAQLIRRTLRVAGFIAGVISYLSPTSDGPRRHETIWSHVHTMILDGLDERAEDAVDRGLLAVVEVTRAEISEAYHLVREHQGQKVPEHCSLFFDALDLGTDLLATHLGVSPATAPRRDSVHPATRSKYSGALERYPIDIRTCVINDVRRYFPGQSITVPDRLVQAVQATYHEPIDQLVPEDAGLFAGLLLATPALAFALRDADFAPEMFVDDDLAFAPNDHPTWGYAWTVSLGRMFFGDDGTPTEVAKRTLASKEFGVFELLDGIVESMSRPWGHMNQLTFLRKCRDASPSFAAGSLSDQEILSTIRHRARITRMVDPSFAWQQFGLYLNDNSNVKAIAFSPWSLTRFSDWNVESQEHRLVRGNVVQEVGSLSSEVLTQLEWLIAHELPEADFQRFLEENPSVLLALGPYSRALPHVVLHEDDGKKLIPDFFLEVADRRGADLLDLKLPDARIDLRQPRRERFRAGIHEAVAQLRTYRDWFRSSEHRNRFSLQTGINSFLPRAIIVFGRSMDFQSHLDRQRLEATLPEWAKLFTYDDLLTSARRWMQRSR